MINVDAKTILWIALTIGGVMGGILTAINKFRYVPKKDFDEHKKTCPVTICVKIDTVKESVNGLKDTLETNAKESQDRRELDKKELNENLLKIATFMGGVEQFMKKNSKG